jgi:hypothetical protein
MDFVPDKHLDWDVDAANPKLLGLLRQCSVGLELPGGLDRKTSEVGWTLCFMAGDRVRARCEGAVDGDVSPGIAGGDTGTGGKHSAEPEAPQMLCALVLRPATAAGRARNALSPWLMAQAPICTRRWPFGGSAGWGHPVVPIHVCQSQ